MLLDYLLQLHLQSTGSSPRGYYTSTRSYQWVSWFHPMRAPKTGPTGSLHFVSYLQLKCVFGPSYPVYTSWSLILSKYHIFTQCVLDWHWRPEAVTLSDFFPALLLVIQPLSVHLFPETRARQTDRRTWRARVPRTEVFASPIKRGRSRQRLPYFYFEIPVWVAEYDVHSYIC